MVINSQAAFGHMVGLELGARLDLNVVLLRCPMKNLTETRDT